MAVTSKIKSTALLFVFVSFTLLLPSELFAQESSLYDINNGDLLINEINWSGSSISNNDEWIELYNNSTVDINLDEVLLIVNETDIQLSGQIKYGGYFVIRRENSTNTNLTLLESFNLTSSKLSISNTSFDIKLQYKDKIIDEVNTAGKKPFAGQNDSEDDVNSSMARINGLTNSSDPKSWRNSIDRKNLLNKPEFCQKDFGTPGYENFDSTAERVIEFEDSCGQNEIVNDEFVKIAGPKNNLNILNLNHNFEQINQKYELQIQFKSENYKDIFLNLNIDFGQNKILSFNEEVKNEKHTSRFAKPASLTSAEISLNITTPTNSTILIDKLIIRKIDETSDKFSINVNEFNNSNYLNNEIFIDKNTPKSIHSNSSVREINFNSTSLNTAGFYLKFENISNGLALNEVISIIRVRNIFTGSQKEKKIRLKDIQEGIYIPYQLDFAAETSGSIIYEVIPTGKSDIYFKNIEIEKTKIQDERKLNILDYLNEQNKINFSNSNTILINKSENSQSKLLDLPFDNYCIGSSFCSLEIQIKIFNIDRLSSDTRILDLSIARISNDNQKEISNFHLKYKDFIKNEYIFKPDIKLDSNTKFSLKGYNYNNASIELSDVLIKSSNSNENKIKFIDEGNKFVQDQLQMKNRKINSDGDSISSILKTNKQIQSGTYNFKFNIKKATNTNTRNILIKVQIYDDIGRKLLEQSIKDNEISYYSFKTIQNEINISTKSRIYIYFKSPNNQNNIKIENLAIEKYK